MNKVIAILSGALIIVLFSFVIIVMMPTMQAKNNTQDPNIKPYNVSESRGRDMYVSLGCLHCHTQQVRDSIWSTDEARGWGRPSVSTDYRYDTPHQLGTMRTGPDLMNIGVRQPSDIWHLMHLYQPRSVVPDSIMPAYPFLFKEVDEVTKGDVVISMPPQFKRDKKIVAKQEAIDLTNYMKALKRNHPVPKK
jgi:cytochrome c oxidase cbb3-type subunit II